MMDLTPRTHDPVLYADLSGLDIVKNPADRAHWLELRRNGIGGSEAAAIVGVDPWSTPFEVFHDKKGNVPAKEQTRFMEWGHRLEDSVRRWFADETGLEVVKRDVMYAHPKHPWMLANLDAEVGDDAILECKNTDARNADDWEDGPPLHYTLQTNHYLAVSGRRRAYVAVLIGGNDPRYFTLERDDELIDMLIAREERFWFDHVVADVEPDVTGRIGDTDVLRGLYPGETGSEMILPPDVVRLLLDRAAAKKAIKAAEAVVDDCENRVKQILGDHEIGLGVDGSTLCTWKSNLTTKFNQKQLKEDHPEIYEQYAYKAPQRRFLSNVGEDEG